MRHAQELGDERPCRGSSSFSATWSASSEISRPRSIAPEREGGSRAGGTASLRQAQPRARGPGLRTAGSSRSGETSSAPCARGDSDNYVRGVAAEALGQLALALGAPEDAVVQLEPRLAFARREESPSRALPVRRRSDRSAGRAGAPRRRPRDPRLVRGQRSPARARLALANCRRCRGLLAGSGRRARGRARALRGRARVAWPGRIPLDEGRTLLALGVAQRRAKRRREARATLEQALALFERSAPRSGRSVLAVSFAESAVAHPRRARSPPPRNVSRPSSPGERRIARSRPRCSSPIGRSRGTSRASSESSASGTAPSWLERSNPANHRGSQSQTRVIRPFRPSRPLHSLETGGQEGHLETRRWSDDPQDLVHHRRRRRGARTRRSRVRRLVGRRPESGNRPRLAGPRRSGRRREATGAHGMLDARERSFAAKSEATRVVSTDPVRDDRFRLDPARPPPRRRSARLTRPSGCRSGSGSAAASCSRSASSWPCG